MKEGYIDMIFVTVGSQKFQFDRLLKKIDELIDDNVIDEPVYAQIGACGYKPHNFDYVDYMPQEEFEKRINESSLVITHAGTGAIFNAITQKKKVIAIPRLEKYNEHVDNHQLQIVKRFDRLKLIEPCYKIEDLETAYRNVYLKNYKEYISNTDRIIKSIESYIG